MTRTDELRSSPARNRADGPPVGVAGPGPHRPRRRCPAVLEPRPAAGPRLRRDVLRQAGVLAAALRRRDAGARLAQEARRRVHRGQPRRVLHGRRRLRRAPPGRQVGHRRRRGAARGRLGLGLAVLRSPCSARCRSSSWAERAAAVRVDRRSGASRRSSSRSRARTSSCRAPRSSTSSSCSSRCAGSRRCSSTATGAARSSPRRSGRCRAARGPPGWGPWLGWRPWRWVAGVSLGLCTGTKWSGLFFLAAFGLMSVWWDMGPGARPGCGAGGSGPCSRTGRSPRWRWSARPRSSTSCRGRAGSSPRSATTGSGTRSTPARACSGCRPVLRNWVTYHQDAYTFNTTLETPHPYQSNPWSWMVQTRPTSFYYESPTRGVDGCTVEQCSQAINPIGTISVWWLGILALLVVLWWWLVRRDWRAGAIAAGFVGGYLPWFVYQDRTIYTFYAVAFEPWVVLAVTFLDRPVRGATRGRPGAVAAAVARRRRVPPAHPGAVRVLPPRLRRRHDPLRALALADVVPQLDLSRRRTARVPVPDAAPGPLSVGIGLGFRACSSSATTVGSSSARATCARPQRASSRSSRARRRPGSGGRRRGRRRPDGRARHPRWATSTSRPSCAGSPAHRGRVVQFERPRVLPDDLGAGPRPDGRGAVLRGRGRLPGHLLRRRVRRARRLPRAHRRRLARQRHQARPHRERAGAPADRRVCRAAEVLGRAHRPPSHASSSAAATSATSPSTTSSPSTSPPGAPRRPPRRPPDGPTPATWGDPRWLACGRCEVCEPEVEAAATSSSSRDAWPDPATVPRRGRPHGRRPRDAHRAGPRRAHRRPSTAARAGPPPARAGARPATARARPRSPTSSPCAGCRARAPVTSSSTSRATRCGPSTGRPRGGWSTSSASSRSTPASRCSAPSGPTTATRSARPSSTS